MQGCAVILDSVKLAQSVCNQLGIRTELPKNGVEMATPTNRSHIHRGCLPDSLRIDSRL